MFGEAVRKRQFFSFNAGRMPTARYQANCLSQRQGRVPKNFGKSFFLTLISPECTKSLHLLEARTQAACDFCALQLTRSHPPEKIIASCDHLILLFRKRRGKASLKQSGLQCSRCLCSAWKCGNEPQALFPYFGVCVATGHATFDAALLRLFDYVKKFPLLIQWN